MLPTEDADISRLVERGLKRQGIERAHGHADRGRAARRSERDASPTASESAEVDYLVIAAGRGADVDGARARTRRASSSTSAAWSRSTARCARRARASMRSATSSPGPALAHKASDEGIIAVEDSAGPARRTRSSYVDIPRATFCTPNVGSFGLTEEQAREQGYDVVVGKVPYGAVGGGTVYGDRTGLVKLVGESQVRRAARRAHRRRARDRADPGARQRARARGRLSRRSRASSTATRRCRRP